MREFVIKRFSFIMFSYMSSLFFNSAFFRRCNSGKSKINHPGDNGNNFSDFNVHIDVRQRNYGFVKFKHSNLGVSGNIAKLPDKIFRTLYVLPGFSLSQKDHACKVPNSVSNNKIKGIKAIFTPVRLLISTIWSIKEIIPNIAIARYLDAFLRNAISNASMASITTTHKIICGSNIVFPPLRMPISMFKPFTFRFAIHEETVNWVVNKNSIAAIPRF